MVSMEALLSKLIIYAFEEREMAIFISHILTGPRGWVPVSVVRSGGLASEGVWAVWSCR